MAIDAATLETIDNVVQGAAAALGIFVIGWALRRGTWRDPLPALLPNPDGPSGLAIVITIGIYLVGAMLAQQFAHISAADFSREKNAHNSGNKSDTHLRVAKLRFRYGEAEIANAG